MGISTVFGVVQTLAESWKQQEESLATTPCSISGMTRILEPQIQRDFPEFNWMQFRNMAEEALKRSLTAITAHDADCLNDMPEQLREQVESRILDQEASGIQEVFKGIRVHQTEIAKYEKRNGRCIVTLQSAVEYIHYKEKDGKPFRGRCDTTEQAKYNMELMYIQDADAAKEDHGVGLTCPNCGAPVTALGVKRCDYCGGEVIPINLNVWSLQNFYEVTYQKV